MRRIYLDYNASTPVAPEVAKLMRNVQDGAFGNPSSSHWAGLPPRSLIDSGRQQVAGLLGCSAKEIVFTSGGSESNNLALKGAFFAADEKRQHFITTQIEHPAILAPCAFLERLGADVSYLQVDSTGIVDPDDLRRAIRADTTLISVMHANNETGAIQPIAEMAAIAREHLIPFHTDAAQSIGKIPARVDELGVDLLSLAGHKCYAPKGIGALYIRKGLRLEPLIHGAAHEHGLRAGTESALLIAALGAAADLASDLSGVGHIRILRDLLWRALRRQFGDEVQLNGPVDRRLPNTLNVSFVGRSGAGLLAQLEGVAASTGSACHSGQIELSPVLKAMGVSPDTGQGAVRFSLGRPTTETDIESLAELFRQVFPQ